MNAEYRNKALKAKGFKIGDIAEAIEKHRSTVSGVIKGSITSKPIAKQIAILMGEPLEKAFKDKPEYFTETNVKQINIAKIKSELQLAS